MKKVIILLLSIFLLSGCTKIEEINYDEIIASVVTSKYNITNQTRSGYKYYVPSGMSSIKTEEYNEVIASSNYNYYLYVDVVSYYNRVLKEFDIDTSSYYSYPINYEDKYGYLEINRQDNGKYLVEIMYNYAKIEVIVEECDLKNTVTNSIIMLSSINYNNEILENIIGDNILEYSEENYNIFQTKKKDSANYLDVEEPTEEYQDEDDFDPDLVVD